MAPLDMIDAPRLLELLLPGGIIGVLGWWSGQRQGTEAERSRSRERVLQSEEAQGNRALREADQMREEWNEIKSYWTVELTRARLEEEECFKRYNALWRWAVKLAEKWNQHHPDDPCDLPNGNGNGTPQRGEPA